MRSAGLFLGLCMLVSSTGNTLAASPTPTVSISAPKIVSGTVTVSAFATESGGTIASVQFEVDGAPLGSLITAPASPYQISWDSTTVKDGSHVLTAVATDTAGVSGTSLPDTVTVANTTVAPTISMTAPANGASVSGTVTVSASATDTSGTVSSVQFFLDGNSLGVPLTAAPYQITWDTTTATNGSHTLSAQANNSAGQDTTSAPVTITVSGGVTEPPPTVALVSPTNGAVLTGTVTFAATADQVSGRVTQVGFLMDGAPLRANIPIPPYQFDFNTITIPNGSHVFEATATNDAGETTTSVPVTATVANSPSFTPPTVSMTSPANGATVSGSVALSAGADDVDATVISVQFLLDGLPLGAAVTAAPYHMNWDSTTVPNGSHTLAATATNDAGQSTTSAAVTVTVSNNVAPPPPTVAITTPVDGATLTGVVTVTATAAEAEASGNVTSVRFMLDGAPLGTALIAAPYSLSWDTTTIANGSHVLTAVAVNDANETTTSAPVTVTINNVTLPPPPTVAITSPVSGVTVSKKVVITAAAADSGGKVTQVQFFLNGSAMGPAQTQAPYQIIWKTRRVPNGAVTLTAVATNDSGETTTSAPVNVTVQNHPGVKCWADERGPGCDFTACAAGYTACRRPLEPDAERQQAQRMPEVSPP